MYLSTDNDTFFPNGWDLLFINEYDKHLYQLIVLDKYYQFKVIHW